MGAFGRGTVLKLVHPGGFVEIHKRPVKASEVMRKNPRHCVTRPDVFRYPWIVVHPESVLELGSLFYIVPNLTIYRLLQAYEASGRKRPDPRLPVNPKESTRKDQACATKNSTWTQPRYIPVDHSGEPQMTQLPGGISKPKNLGVDRSRPIQAHLNGSPSEPPLQVLGSTTKAHRSRPGLERSTVRYWSKAISPDDDGEDQYHSGISIVMQDRGVSAVHSNMYHQVRVTPKNQHEKSDKVKLKSCLKKDNQKRSKPDDLKVRFVLPDDHVNYKAKWRVVAQKSQLRWYFP